MMRRRRSVTLVASFVLSFVCRRSHAQEPAPPNGSLPANSQDAPAPVTPPAANPEDAPPTRPPPPPAPRPGNGRKPDRPLATRIVVVPASFTLGRGDVPLGVAVELDVMYRLRLGARTRLDFGVEGRQYENADANHPALGAIFELVREASRYVDLTLTLAPHHTWITFNTPLYEETHGALGFRAGAGLQFIIEDRVLLGLTPLALNVMSSGAVGTITQWEPRGWFGLTF